MKLFIPVGVVLLLLVSFVLSHPVNPSEEITADNSKEQHSLTILDMETSESKVKKFYKRTGYGYGYGGYALPLVPRFYPTVGATVLVGYPLLTGYGYGGYGGVIPYPGYGYGR